MATATSTYLANPKTNRDRKLGASVSTWVRSFACDDMSVLIVCRGPIRKEAIDVFREMGMTNVGILLSEKDSIVYPRALAPELRILDPKNVHEIPDYTGATKEERMVRVQQMISICRKSGYRYVFAGYGFMSEDADFVRAIENAGLTFIGPCSYTQGAAGMKDEAKRTALENRVSVTPGLNNATAQILLAKHPGREGLAKVAADHGLSVPSIADASLDLADVADEVLAAAYGAGIDLYSVDELSSFLQKEAEKLLVEYAGCRFRLKAIGGGGGKGQRIFGDASAVPGLVLEILNEVKTTGVGDNKNILLELNIEQTRHNEIQLLGNGEWCVTLGGRDCSLQMHEQKLLEVSVTQEALASEIASARAAGNSLVEAALTTDLETLRRMEEEAERFGAAVKLDSASTFECIVEGARHYFMEVNTRIQVEHRVSELCYGLRFTNPADAQDSFEIHSLVEAMAVIAKHKTRLPRPVRVARDGAALEARLNATDRSLSPHAGGVIVGWSDPIDGEIRDDQGISLTNPDTGLFMRYRLAGAYDSNIALLLSTGASRAASYDAMAEILRSTDLRGPDLATNLEFHYGLVSFFVSHGVWAKPTTKFVVPYLTLVGELKREASAIDLDHAFKRVASAAIAAAGKEAASATKRVFERKETLLERPLGRLFEEPHFLSAWLSQHRTDFVVEGSQVVWKKNPIELLADTYHLLHMDDQPGAPAARVIFAHDQELLDTALGFYRRLQESIPVGTEWSQIDTTLRGEAPAWGFDADLWGRVRAAHAGHQLGLEILRVLPLLASRVGFYDLYVNDDLTVTIPERLHDAALQVAMKKVLAPPPSTKADEIVAVSGGMFYGQETPASPSFLTKGTHFNVGDPLYIVEVMKMFNKVYATFAGTVDEVLIEGAGTIVQKGQPLFKVTPDERMVEEDQGLRTASRRANTNTYFA